MVLLDHPRPVPHPHHCPCGQEWTCERGPCLAADETLCEECLDAAEHVAPECVQPRKCIASISKSGPAWRDCHEVKDRCEAAARYIETALHLIDHCEGPSDLYPIMEACRSAAKVLRCEK